MSPFHPLACVSVTKRCSGGDTRAKRWRRRSEFLSCWCDGVYFNPGHFVLRISKANQRFLEALHVIMSSLQWLSSVFWVQKSFKQNYHLWPKSPRTKQVNNQQGNLQQLRPSKSWVSCNSNYKRRDAVDVLGCWWWLWMWSSLGGSTEVGALEECPAGWERDCQDFGGGRWESVRKMEDDSNWAAWGNANLT